MTTIHLLYIFSIVSSLLPHASCFSPASGHISPPIRAIHSTPILRTTSRLLSTDDKQEEIAALEERLRRLKEEDSPPETIADVEPKSVAMDFTADEPDGMEGESEDSVMFSERWKEAKDDYVAKQEESNMGGIAKVALALGFVVFLGFFAQVPVGEESLQKYQDVKGNPSRIDLGDLNTVD
ncbi:hypothetical protein ACHAXR_006169 [Thalassiosira sp. AJA248-18]